MRVVIVGAGFTGVQLAKILVNEKNNVTVIDNNEEITRHVADQVDCTVLTQDGNNLENLEEAGIAKADALVCLTDSDEVNMITCSLVDAFYPDILKIARVRNYAYYVNTAAAKKNHAGDFPENHRPLYGIDYMIHPDVEAAEAIVEAVENGAVSNIVSFDNSEMQISRIPVSEGSALAGHTLMELRNLTDIHMLVCYVEIDGKTSLPSGPTVMNAGCMLGVLSSKEDVSRILELCGSEQKDLKKIAIVGAGRIGTLIASKLYEPKKAFGVNFIGRKKPSQKIAIIDTDSELAKAASERFPYANVLCGDATDESFLREENIPDFDLAICATHNHELNMVVAAYLESLGVKQSISLVNSSAFADIATKLGVDVSIALRDVIVDSIMSHMRGNAVKEVHTITNGDFEIIECEVKENSSVIGKMLKDIAEPGKYLVLLDRHSGAEEYEIAGGNTIFAAGDHLVLITDSEESRRILGLFGNVNE
ncbi:MAG: NAD-binding protein [Treponema sp.]|nr:NAD-binding protein [Treponema sp.]